MKEEQGIVMGNDPRRELGHESGIDWLICFPCWRVHQDKYIHKGFVNLTLRFPLFVGIFTVVYLVNCEFDSNPSLVGINCGLVLLVGVNFLSGHQVVSSLSWPTSDFLWTSWKSFLAVAAESNPECSWTFWSKQMRIWLIFGWYISGYLSSEQDEISGHCWSLIGTSSLKISGYELVLVHFLSPAGVLEVSGSPPHMKKNVCEYNFGFLCEWQMVPLTP